MYRLPALVNGSLDFAVHRFQQQTHNINHKRSHSPFMAMHPVSPTQKRNFEMSSLFRRHFKIPFCFTDLMLFYSGMLCRVFHGYFAVLVASIPRARIMPKNTSVLSMTPLKYSEPGPSAFSGTSSAAWHSSPIVSGIFAGMSSTGFLS